MTTNENIETPVTDEAPSKFSALKTRISQLPLKKIAIAAAVTTAAAIVVANREKFENKAVSYEATNLEILPDGTILADVTPIDD